MQCAFISPSAVCTGVTWRGDIGKEPLGWDVALLKSNMTTKVASCEIASTIEGLERTIDMDFR